MVNVSTAVLWIKLPWDLTPLHISCSIFPLETFGLVFLWRPHQWRNLLVVAVQYTLYKCTVHSPAHSRTWLFGKMVITYQLTGIHFSPTSIHSQTNCEPNYKKTAHLHIFCTLPIAYYLRSDSWFKGKGRFKLGPLVRNAVIPGMHKCLEMRVKLFAPSCNQQCTL